VSYVFKVVWGLVAVGLVLLLVDADLTLRDFRNKTLPQITQAATDIDRSAYILGAAAGNVEKGTRVWQDKQIALADQTSSSILILNSDLTQMGTLLSTANSAVLTQSSSLTSLQAEAIASIKQLDSSLQAPMLNFSDATANFSKASETFSAGLTATMPDLEETAKQAAGTAANVDATTKDVKDFVHRETTPVRGTWNVIKSFLFEIAGPAASVASSMK